MVRPCSGDTGQGRAVIPGADGPIRLELRVPAGERRGAGRPQFALRLPAYTGIAFVFHAYSAPRYALLPFEQRCSG